MRGRRARLGAGALVAVLLLVAAAGGMLGIYYADRAEAERRAEDREAGRVFALWLQATHRASMEADFRARLAGGGFVLTLAELRGLGVVPPGLPETVGRGAPFSVGIIDDRAGVPMAFGVVEPEPWAHTASLREGVLEGGVVQIEDVSGSGSEMHVHVAAIETALGRSAAAGGMFVTADRGVRYREGVLYRRAQPGQRRLNRMETTLNAGGCGPSNADPCNVLDGGWIGAEQVAVTPDPVMPRASTVGGAGTVATRTAAASLDVAGTCSDSAGQQVLCSHPDARAALAPGNFTGMEVSGQGLTVRQALVVGSAVSDGVTTVDMAATGHVQAGAVSAPTMTGQDATAANAVGVSGSSTVGTLGSSSLAVTGSMTVHDTVLAGLYGPSANMTTLSVDSCAGCYSP